MTLFHPTGSGTCHRHPLHTMPCVMCLSESAAPQEIEPTERLSSRWQELFWALPPGEMRHKLRSLEIDVSQSLAGSQEIERLKAENEALRRKNVTLRNAWLTSESDRKAALFDRDRANEARTDAERTLNDERAMRLVKQAALIDAKVRQAVHGEMREKDEQLHHVKAKLAEAERVRDEALVGRDRYHKALTNHLCQHDLADWLGCNFNHTEVCEVCACEDGQQTRHALLVRAEAAEAKLSASDQAHAQMREAMTELQRRTAHDGDMADYAVHAFIVAALGAPAETP